VNSGVGVHARQWRRAWRYLGSKAKDLNADMQVFGDEFIAKINEVHGA
jgi:hypothetical protein